MIIDTEEWISVAEYAKAVGERPSWITYYVNNKRLKTIRMGRYHYIHIDEIPKWPLPYDKLGRPKWKKQSE